MEVDDKMRKFMERHGFSDYFEAMRQKGYTNWNCFMQYTTKQIESMARHLNMQPGAMTNLVLLTKDEQKKLLKKNSILR